MAPEPVGGWPRGSFGRLAAIVQSSDDAIITKTPDGTITSWNSAATRIFGYDPLDAIGRHITMLFPVERLAEEDELMARIARADRVEHFETERLRKDGSRVAVSVTLSPVRDQHGRIVEISHIARDITGRRLLDAARHKAEQQVRERDQQLATELAAMTSMQRVSMRLVQAGDVSTLMNEMLDAAIEITGADTGTVQLFDGAALKIRAQRGFEAPFLAYFDEAEEGRIISATALGTGRRVIVDDVDRSPMLAGTAALDVMRSAGVRALQSTPLVSRAGRMLGVFSTQYRRPHHPAERDLRLLDVLARQAADLIERTQAENALASASETTRAFFESAAEGIVVVSRTGDIVRGNRRLAEMFGYAEGELVGQSVEILLPHRFRASHGGHRANYFASPRTRSMGVGLDLFGLRKDGVEFPVEIGLSPIETAEGAFVMALITDISERRSLEQAARHREKLATLATLSAGIAHELNNPIGIISTRIELMLQEAVSKPLPSQTIEDLHVLYRNIQRVAAIAKGVLTFARHAPDDTGLVDLNSVVDETLLLLGKPLAKDGVRATVSLDPRLAPVWGNANSLQQVLTNLLLNARDAMPRGGEVRIQTAVPPERPGCVRLVIADTGDGMTPEALTKIWEPFYTTKPSGTGLGLSVTQRIIREHDGAVDVQSIPGHGTTFTITLPVRSSDSV
ncbi:MAG TPA: PAS domain S-box protein [Methylomirabilota bacterium]|nr:PAS domain S-box protein [Methylomirabilota bacterium]